jgi:hypothetical protein
MGILKDIFKLLLKMLACVEQKYKPLLKLLWVFFEVLCQEVIFKIKIFFEVLC